MSAIRRPVDRTDPSVLTFDAVLGEFNFGVGFLQVHEDDVAVSEYHLVISGRRFGANLRRRQAFGFTGTFAGFFGQRGVRFLAQFRRSESLIGFNDPGFGNGFETHTSVVQRDDSGERPFLRCHLVLGKFGQSCRHFLMVERRPDLPRYAIRQFPGLS